MAGAEWERVIARETIEYVRQAMQVPYTWLGWRQPYSASGPFRE